MQPMSRKKGRINSMVKRPKFNPRKIQLTAFALFAIIAIIILPQTLSGTFAADAPDLNYYEQKVVELTNAKRAENGLNPLRLNRELSAAARWFSQDSILNRPPGYCGHQATDGSWPDARAIRFGYYGTAGAENAFCGLVTPEQAVDGWMNSPGHRANILNPDSREIGLGYYLDSNSGRGYVAQMFGQDAAYPPVLINSDAVTTTSPNVALYIYGALANSDALYGLGQPIQMRVSNRADFAGATWETFSNNRSWALDGTNTGFKTVYVQLQDAAGKSTVSSDNIYYGPTIPYGYLDTLAQGSTHLETLTLSNLSSGGAAYMQFSNNWGLNSQSGKMSLNWGQGGTVNDADATGGKAFQLKTNGSNESQAWLYTTSYMKNLPSQVYFRLKLSTLAAPNAKVRFTVGAAGVNTESLLTAADFKSAGVYQEFPVSFTQANNPQNAFLTLAVSFSDPDNLAAVNVDRMDFYTAPEAFAAIKTWAVPNKNYRGATIKVRYTNNAAKSPDFSDPVVLGPYLPPVYNPTVPVDIPTPTVPVGPTATPGSGDSTDPAFALVWGRTDDPILKGLVSRSWMWGDRPNGFALLRESYDGRQRLVQYHDKSRMEINNPNGNRADLFFVTNGLLVREMISGDLQMGDAVFNTKTPADIPVAGDPNSSGQNPNAPTYASFKGVASLNNDRRSSDRSGQLVTTFLAKDGSTRELSSQPANVRSVYYDSNLGHNIPDVFWNFMNSRGKVLQGGSYVDDQIVNWVYAMGYPLSEPFWTKSIVAGQERDVLVQVFQRRVLSYTPTNPAGFQVEMGNVGRHYYLWRYGTSPA